MKLPEPGHRHWRLDRWLTLSAARPLSALAPHAGEGAIPILMYHSVSDEVDDDLHPYLRTVTTPAVFARQMAQLAAHGLHAVSLAAATHALRNAALGPEVARKTVVITFDDGFRDFAVHAWPVLARHGFTATVFLASGFVGRDFVTGRPCLNEREVRRLVDRGVEFGSHSATHPKLVELPPERQLSELLDSRRAIEDITGQAVTLFSYPYRFPQEDAAFTRHFGDMLSYCGYVAGVTTIIGRSRPRDDLRFLPRLPVNDCDDEPLFAAKLDGHYDWLRGVQHARKQVRALMHRPRVAA